MPGLRSALPLAGCCALILLVGCQGGASTPSAPVPAIPGAQPMALPVTPEPGWVDAGAFELAIDVATLDFTLAPLRHTSAIGDTFSELGLTPGFTRLFGKNFEVKSIRRGTGGTIEVETYIRHPFSPANRPDLAIFNLKCWVVTDRPGVSLDGHLTAPGTLANADGYGNMWQVTHDVSVPGFFAAPVQPYVILREDPSSAPFDWTNPAGFNVFFPGQDSVDTLVLDPGTAGALNLKLYLTADYGQSAVRQTRQSPEYELPKFAGNAPWKVAVTELANDLVPGNAASSAEYRVDIWDWKHGQGFSSDVASATLSIPGVTSAASTLTLSGTGQDPDPLTATTLVLNGQSAGEGDYWGLVVVTDTATGTGLLENLSTPVPISQYRTFQVFPVAIEALGIPPTAVVERVGCPGDVKVGVDALFDGSTSTPGTAPIVAYDWDYDYDGITFDVDATGMSISRPSTTPGTFTVALRVTDSSALSDIATTTVTVVALAPPAWQAPVRITNNTSEEYFDAEGDEVLAMGPDGTVHLLYNTYVWSSEHRLEYMTYGGCPPTWSAPEVVNNNPLSGYNRTPSIEVTADGTVHIVYFNLQNAWLYRSKPVAGSWSGPQTVGTQPYTGSLWQNSFLAQSPSGKLGLMMQHMVQFSAVCPGSPAMQAPILFREWDGVSWGAQSQVAGADVIHTVSGCGSLSWWTESGDIIALPNDDFLIAWEDLDQPYMGTPTISATHVGWIRQTSGVWGTEGDLYVTNNPAMRGDGVKLARSPNGTVWLAFSRTASTLALAQYDGTNWSASPTIVMNLNGYTGPVLHFDGDGRAALYGGQYFGTGALRYKRFHQSDSLAAIAALPEDPPQAATPWARNLGGTVQLGDGRALVLWRSDQWGTGAARELEAAFWQ